MELTESDMEAFNGFTGMDAKTRYGNEGACPDYRSNTTGHLAGEKWKSLRAVNRSENLLSDRWSGKAD